MSLWQLLCDVSIIIVVQFQATVGLCLYVYVSILIKILKYRSLAQLQSPILLVVLIANVLALSINVVNVAFVVICVYNCRYCEVNVKWKFVPSHMLLYRSTHCINVVAVVVSAFVCCYNC
jgi:uncharacterized protein with PQ loop repeat